MKKSELANLTIGTKVISKKDESIHEVLEVTENYVQLGERAYSKSTIQRWYNIYTEPVVEEKPVEVVPEDKTSTVEEKEHIEDQLNVLSVSLTNVLDYCEQMNCTLKQNSNHIAVKYCNKNVMEIHPTKRKGICAVVRHTLFTDDEIKQLKDAKIIGAGTYVIDLKFRIESMEQFKDILGTAIYCK